MNDIRSVIQWCLTVSLAQLERLQAHVLDHAVAWAQRARHRVCQTRRLHVLGGVWMDVSLILFLS